MGRARFSSGIFGRDRVACPRLAVRAMGTVGLMAGLATGCASPDRLEPPTVGQVLSDTERRDAFGAMRSVVPEDFEPRAIRTAARPTTWRDVPGVVAVTAARHEMAVLRRVAEADRFLFELRTLDDRPARIAAIRAPDGAIRFEATVGRFADDAPLAASLVATAEAIARAGVGRVTVAEMLDPTLWP